MSDPRDVERARAVAAECWMSWHSNSAVFIDRAEPIILRVIEDARREDREEIAKLSKLLDTAVEEAKDRSCLVAKLMTERDEARLAAENTAHLAAHYQMESAAFMAERDRLRAERSESRACDKPGVDV